MSERVSASTGLLLVRPMALPGEDPCGYLARVAAANGLTRIAAGDGAAVAAAATRSGLVVPALWRLPAAVRRYRTAPACMHCFVDRSPILQAWRFRRLEACPHHGLPLVRACPMCDNPLTSAEHLARRCRCGHELSHAQASPMPAAQTSLLAAVWTSACQPRATESDAAAAAAASELLLIVARARRGRDVSMKNCSEMAHAAAWLEHAGMEPPDPRCLEGWLSQLKETIHLAAAAVTLRAWIKAEQRHPTAFSGLPLARWLQVLDQRGAPRRKRQHVPIIPPADHGPLYSVGAISRQLNVDSDAVVRRARELQMDVVEHQHGLRRFRFVSSNDAEALRESLMKEPPAPLSLRMTGLGRTGQRRLKQTYLAPSPRTRWPIGSFDPSAVLSLLQSLESAPHLPGSSPVVPLDSPCLWRRHAAEAIRELVAQLRAGTWPLRRTGRTGLGGFEISVEALAALRRRTRTCFMEGRRARCAMPGQMPLFAADACPRPSAIRERGLHHDALC